MSTTFARFVHDADIDHNGAVTLHEIRSSLLKTFPTGYHGGMPFSPLSTKFAPLSKLHLLAFDTLDVDGDGSLTQSQFQRFGEWVMDASSLNYDQPIAFLWRSALWSVQQFLLIVTHGMHACSINQLFLGLWGALIPPQMAAAEEAFFHLIMNYLDHGTYVQNI